METLAKLREEWESSLTVLAAVPIVIGEFKKLLVIANHQGGDRHSLFRYFQLNGGWVVSVDVAFGTLDDCFSRMDRDSDLSELRQLIGAA